MLRIGGIYEGLYLRVRALAFWAEFLLTGRGAGFRLVVMDKQEIKKRLLEAVKHDAHLADIDLLTPQAISKYFRDEVLAQAEYVYEK